MVLPGLPVENGASIRAGGMVIRDSSALGTALGIPSVCKPQHSADCLISIYVADVTGPRHRTTAAGPRLP